MLPVVWLWALHVCVLFTVNKSVCVWGGCRKPEVRRVQWCVLNACVGGLRSRTTEVKFAKTEHKHPHPSSPFIYGGMAIKSVTWSPGPHEPVCVCVNNACGHVGAQTWTSNNVNYYMWKMSRAKEDQAEMWSIGKKKKVCSIWFIEQP